MYFGTDGVLQTNTVTPDGYLLDESGQSLGRVSDISRSKALANSIIKGVEAVGAKWSADGSSLVLADGSYARNGWFSLLDEKAQIFRNYRFNTLATMQTGMITDDGWTYYLSEVTGDELGSLKTGYVSIAGNVYYFNPSSVGTAPYGALMKNATLPDGRRTDSMGRVQ